MTFAAFFVPGTVFWPYFAGLAILAVGVVTPLAGETRGAGRSIRGPKHRLDPLVRQGSLLFAISMAIFSADHFVFAKFVATVVPRWIPWHAFWTYFVGCALIAAALSLAADKYSGLAALMLGAMIFLFVLLIHLPNWFAVPSDRTRSTLALRDLALSAGALSHAGSRLAAPIPAFKKLTAPARLVIAIAAVYFGVQHFLFPPFAPGIPRDDPGLTISMPPWIPGHAVWAYLTGAIFIACGLALLMNKQARFAASLLGAIILVLVVFVYVPWTITNIGDVNSGLNYLSIHLALAGAALFLADALPENAAVDRAPASDLELKIAD